MDASKDLPKEEPKEVLDIQKQIDAINESYFFGLKLWMTNFLDQTFRI